MFYLFTIAWYIFFITLNLVYVLSYRDGDKKMDIKNDIIKV